MFRSWVISSVVSVTAVSLCIAQSSEKRPEGRPVITAAFAEPANPVNLSRYQYPEECHHTVVRLLDSVAMATRADTLRYTITDSLPFVAIQAAQRCLAGFPLATAEPAQLRTLLNLAILNGDESLIRAVVSQQLTLVTSGSIRERATILKTVISQLVYAHPVRIQLAYAFAEQADRLGDDALLERANIRIILRQVTKYTANIDSLISQSRLIVDHLQRVPPDVMSASEQEFLAAWFIPQEQKTLRLFQYIRNVEEGDFLEYVKTTGSMGQTLIGQSAPPLTGDFWFNTSGAEPPPVAVPGRVSLVVFVDQARKGRDIHYGYATLKRLQQRFPELRLLLVAATNGYFRDLAVPMSPQQEAGVIHHYLTDTLSLPGMLTVSTRPYEKYSNGALLPLEVANESSYEISIRDRRDLMFLIDTRGRVVMQTNLDGQADINGAGAENVLTSMIAKLLRKSPPKGASMAPGPIPVPPAQ